MILAGIDIGTNTLRLLIAETGSGFLTDIHSDRRITRLGENLDKTGQLSPEARERSISAIAQFCDDIAKYAPQAVRAVGTSALRTAGNAAAFIDEVRARTGITPEVITGEEEARLTLRGVMAAIPNSTGDESGIAIDIGGGSTEIISFGSRTGVSETSLGLGAVYLTERFLMHDPPRIEELHALRRAIRQALDPVRLAPGRILIGTAGTITTLAAIDRQLIRYDPDSINGWTLSRRSVDQIVSRISRSSIAERRKIIGLEPGREDIILAGAVIAQEIMDRFGASDILVSDWGLREGILLDLHDTMVKNNFV